MDSGSQHFHSVHIIECEFAASGSFSAKQLTFPIFNNDIPKSRKRVSVLTLPSTACLSATIKNGGRDRQTLYQKTLYQTNVAFEEKLPLDLEDVYTQFSVGTSETLGVAIPRASAKSVIEQAASHGFDIQWIVPKAMLDLQALIEQNNFLDKNRTEVSSTMETQLVLLGDPFGVNLFELRDSRPTRWEYFADDSTVLQHCLMDRLHRNFSNDGRSLIETSSKRQGSAIDIQTGDIQTGANSDPAEANSDFSRSVSSSLREHQQMSVLAYGVRPELVHELKEFNAVDLRESQGDLESARRQFVEKLLSGSVCPWINFRSGELASIWLHPTYRNWLSFNLAATVVVLLVCAISLWGRSYTDNIEIEKLENEQAAVFKDLFPKQRVPRSIRRNLESELVRIKATDENPADRPATENAAWVWVHTVNTLPEAGEFRVQTMEFSQSELVTLSGVAGNYEELQRLLDRLHSAKFEFIVPSVAKSGSGLALQIQKATIKNEVLARLGKEWQSENAPTIQSDSLE